MKPKWCDSLRIDLPSQIWYRAILIKVSKKRVYGNNLLCWMNRSENFNFKFTIHELKSPKPSIWLKSSQKPNSSKLSRTPESQNKNTRLMNYKPQAINPSRATLNHPWPSKPVVIMNNSMFILHTQATWVQINPQFKSSKISLPKNSWNYKIVHNLLHLPIHPFSGKCCHQKRNMNPNI